MLQLKGNPEFKSCVMTYCDGKVIRRDFAIRLLDADVARTGDVLVES